jgi:zinc transporter 1/2/3
VVDAEQPLVMNHLNDDDHENVDNHHHQHHHHHQPQLERLSVRSLLLLFGLSIHSLFEGSALGLQTDAGDFIRLLIAIMLHEVLCAFAFGLSLAEQRSPSMASLTSIVFLAGKFAYLIIYFTLFALLSSYASRRLNVNIDEGSTNHLVFF